MNQVDKKTPGKVHFVEIDEDHAGQRLDNFLITKLKGVPRSLIYRICRKGEVRVNKGRARPDYRLVSGDLIRIPPVRVAERTEPAKPADRLLKQLESRILYEDKRLIVLNKPSGVAVHGGSGVNYGVIEALRIMRPEEKSLELVHRLDRDTSGCLLIAKKRSTLRRLHEQLRGTGMEKTYLALVKGRWLGASQLIDAPLQKNTLRSGERIVRVSTEGKSAQSEFSPQAVTDEASLMRVTLHTGRTHQIRVHSSYCGHPIAGDEKYGEENFNRHMKQQHGLKRLFLHAFSLRFQLTEDEPSIYVEAPLDSELLDVLKRLDIHI